MLLKEFLRAPKEVHYTEIPIIINNFNRLDYLKTLLKGLEKRGYTNIFILDNQSTYEPLLEFYKTTKHEVVFLKENYGFRALWRSGLYKKFMGNFFVYTDPDLEIIDECPDNFLDFFRTKLLQNKFALKVGFSLKIDDIPDWYPLKQKVLDWEGPHYAKPTKDGELLKAPIDTTFALYRPFTFKHIRSEHAQIFRAPFPYQMKHLPWYVDPKNLSDEDRYYIEITDPRSWMKKMGKEEAQ